MNKHTEAIQALQPFAALLTNLEDLAQACSVSSTDSDTFTISIKLSDLQEASRVLSEWNKKHSSLSPLKKRIRCKTCGELNYYENLEDGRCSYCVQELEIYLKFSDIEEVKEKGKKRKKAIEGKTDSIYEKLVKQMRALSNEELEEFIQSVPPHDAVVYRKLLLKY